MRWKETLLMKSTGGRAADEEPPRVTDRIETIHDAMVLIAPP